MNKEIIKEFNNRLPVVADELIAKYKRQKYKVDVYTNRDGTKNIKVYK